jgi:aminoglycoside 2'-N-acetyltransferase I
MNASVAAEVRRLCDAAYATDTRPFFDSLGPGGHLLGRHGDVLVAHLMWVTRWLQPDGRGALRTAYVEMVATAPAKQRKGYASALLRAFPPLVQDYELAALCPATESLYARQGWRLWHGPLAARRDGGVIPTPEERAMILALPKTPPLDLTVALSVEWRPGEVW